jgi:hypothetical protein
MPNSIKHITSPTKTSLLWCLEMSLISNELKRPIKNTAVKLWRKLYAVVSARLWGNGSWIHSLRQFLKSLRSVVLLQHTLPCFTDLQSGRQHWNYDDFFWDVTTCRLVEVQRFEGTYCHHLQSQTVSQTKTSKKQAARWRRCAPPRCRWTYTRLYGAVSQKRVLSQSPL